MQSLTLLLAVAPLALAMPQETEAASESGYGLPESIPVSDVLSGLYGTTIPPQATGAVATSLASALYSYELSLYNDEAYKSAANDVYMAMATASNSDEIFSGLESNGALVADFTTAAWFKSGVPEDAQTAIISYWNAYSAVETSVLGMVSATATGTESGSATATGSSTGAESTATETGTQTDMNSGDATSSPSTGGAPMVTAMVGLAAGVAMGVVAAL